MARRTRYSTFDLIRPVIPASLCVFGLLGGLITGAAVIYATGLWREFGLAMKTPFESMSNKDMFVVIGSVLLVFASGWLGARIGIALAAKFHG